MSSDSTLTLRTYEKGDAEYMAAVYNAAMRDQPGFTEDSAERLEQVFSGPNFDPKSKQIAVIDGDVVGYVTTTPSPSDPKRGNVNYPYLHPGIGDEVRDALFDAGLDYLRSKGITNLGTAYFNTANAGQLSYFEAKGFERRSVAFRVIEGDLPAATDAVDAAPCVLRVATPDDFAALCDLHLAALGDVSEPAPMQAEDFERFLAAPFTTAESLMVAELDGKPVGTMIAYAPPKKDDEEEKVGMLTGPTIHPDAWDTPALDGLWTRAIEHLRSLGAISVKSYAADGGTPETSRVLDYFAARGIKGDDVWVHFHSELS